MAQRSRKCSGKKQPQLALSARDLRTATTGELMDEIQRRSVSCMLMAFNVQGLKPCTTHRIYGDSITLRAMSHAMALKLGPLIAGLETQ